MTDLDTALRSMLRERAQDITEVPARITTDLVTETRTRNHRTGWLIAASVAAVLAVVGTTLALTRDDSHHGAPAVTHSVTHSVTPPPTTPPTTPPTPAAHVERRAALDWFGMAALPGFTAHLRESQPGMRLLALRMNSDTGVPYGCNGCESASDYVYVYDKGAFDAAQRHVTNWSPVSINGVTGYLGSSARVGVAGRQVRTVAWQFRPGEWAVVQGVTDAGSTETALLSVARAVRPSESVPITLPMTFGYLPDLPLVDVTDDRSEGYAFTMTFGDVSGRNFGLTVWNGSGWPYYNPTGMTPRSIDGLPGYVGADQGAGVHFHGGGAAFGFGEGSNPITTADQHELDKVIAGLRWVNGDGRAPLVPAEQAIP